MTDDERKLVVELCEQLSIAVTICRMDTGPFRPDESIKSWEALVKRACAWICAPALHFFDCVWLHGGHLKSSFRHSHSPR